MKTIWVGALAVVVCVTAWSADAADDYNFMLAGDSRTEGMASAHGAGYRGYFQNFLATGISSFDFIGTRQTKGGQLPWLPAEEPVLTPDNHALPGGSPASGGLLLDKHHEAIGGIRADGLRDRFRAMNDGDLVDVADGDLQTVSVFDYLSAGPDTWNIVILDIGINDLNIGSGENGTFADIFANGGGGTNLGLLDEIFFADTADLRDGIITDEANLTQRAGNLHVVISTLYDATNFDAAREQNRLDFNNGLQAQINSYSADKGVSISMVDVDRVISPADAFDGTGLHLLDSSVEKVALAYYDHLAIKGLLGGDFDDSGMVTAADIDQLQAMYGANSPPVDPKFDLVEDGVIDGSDLDHLLVKLLRTKAGDTDLNRKVDISDFNTLASNFDPGGANAGTNGWGAGNFDADTDIDITDFNTLASNFDPGGSDAAAALAGQSADPGAVDLIVDLATGEVLLDANSAAISGIQVYSAAAGLLPGDPAPNALQFVIATNATTYAEGAFANLALDGLTSLGLLYDLLADTRDLSFEYTALGQPTVTGQVAYVPEPGSLALLVLTGVALAGYRSVGARRGAVPH